MSRTASVETAIAFVEKIWNSTDGLDRLDAWLTPSYRDHAYAEDREGLEKALSELRAAFPDAWFEIEDAVGEADRAAVRLRLRATHTGPFRGNAPTNREIDLKVFRWFRTVEGRIAEHWALLDTTSLMRQLQS